MVAVPMMAARVLFVESQRESPSRRKNGFFFFSLCILRITTAGVLYPRQAPVVARRAVGDHRMSAKTVKWHRVLKVLWVDESWAGKGWNVSQKLISPFLKKSSSPTPYILTLGPVAPKSTADTSSLPEGPSLQGPKGCLSISRPFDQSIRKRRASSRQPTRPREHNLVSPP